MWRIFNSLVAGVADALFKPNCAICGKPSEDYVCASCDRQLSAHQLANPIQSDPKLPVLLFVWGTYEQALKQAIARCKYQNQPRIAFHLGQRLGEVWQNQPPCQALGKLAVIPIPMHADKLKLRGFNQAEELAKGFCRVTHLPHCPEWLVRVKYTKPQMETKSKQEREANLRQAFQAHVPPHPYQGVILLDDIYTTGVTMRTAMETLAAANVKTLAIVVLARPHFPVTYKKELSKTR
ncbi:MAG: ComF family protein [Pseudanabaenaceae cyanobacterium]